MQQPGGSIDGARSFRVGSALALAVALLLGASGARADGYDEALRNGVAARDHARETGRMSDWRIAYEQFSRAVAENDLMAARFELAEAANALGQLDVAFESYELALEQGLSGKAASVAREFIAAHGADVARLELVAPPGSTVYVNGEKRALLPLGRPLLVPVGRVRLGIVAAHAEPWEKAVYFDAQVVMLLAPDLVETPPPAAPLEEDRGAPSFWSRNPAAVVVASAAGVSLLGGAALYYKYVSVHDLAQDAREQIVSALQRNVADGVVAQDAVPCGPNGIAGGSDVFDEGVPRELRQNVVNDYAGACQLFNERTDRADRYRTLSYVTLGVGVASVAALITWYIADPGAAEPGTDTARARGPSFVPIVSADTQGMSMSFTF